MPDDRGQELTPRVERTSPVRRTPELVIDGKNLDGVTGFPYETPETRRLLINVLTEAIKQKMVFVFVDADLDNLKGLNDLCGHQLANTGIKQFVEEGEQALLEIEQAESVFVYRPQAGGDEFKAVVTFGSDNDNTTVAERIKQKLVNPVEFEYDRENHQKTSLSTSAGIAFKKFSGGETSPAMEFQKLEHEAGAILDDEKVSKIQAGIEETIREGSNLDPDQLLEFIIAKWGAKRITADTLRIIGDLLIARTKACLVKSTR